MWWKFIVNIFQNKVPMDDGVLWKGALAIGGGTAAVLAIVTRAFHNDHPNYVLPEYKWTWLHVHCTLSTLHGNLIRWYLIIPALLSLNCTARILPPQIICAYTCYCRPYLYGLLTLFFFPSDWPFAHPRYV